ncbi:unnamed protein product [Mucor circinelloides]
MTHSNSRNSSKKKKRVMLDKKRTIQIVIPLAHKDPNFTLTTSTNKAKKTENQYKEPRDEPGRTFHCSVCNTSLKTKSDYEDHILQAHRKNSIRKGSHHNNLSTKEYAKRSKDHDLGTKNKTMNPEKISNHSSLLKAENRFIKARNNKSGPTMSLVNGRQAKDKSNMAVNNPDCQIAMPPTSGALDIVPHNYCNICKITLVPDKSHQCPLILPLSAPHHKRRKLNTAPDIVDIEADDQKIERALLESLQESQVEVEIDPIVSKVSSHTHPAMNDPNNYCRVCHVSHSTQEAYQIHLQTEHHAAFPSSSAKRKAQKVPVSTRPNNLCKYVPIQIRFDPKSSSLSSPTTTQEQMKDANVLPDLDDPNYYCRSCHITKPNRTSYLIHLCMIHQITSGKRKNDKAPKAKLKY